MPFIAKKQSLSDARKDGSQFYWSGLLCPNGHMTYRYVNGHRCRACLKTSNSRSRCEEQPDADAVTARRAIEDRPRKPRDEYDYDL